MAIQDIPLEAYVPFRRTHSEGWRARGGPSFGRHRLGQRPVHAVAGKASAMSAEVAARRGKTDPVPSSQHHPRDPFRIEPCQPNRQELR